MKLSDQLLPEFDQEVANTRKTLERVPDDKFDWKPHEKSMTLGKLANHLTEIPGWAMVTMEQDQFDMMPAGGQSYQAPTGKNRQELLRIFDEGVSKTRASIAKASDEHFMKNWALLKGGEKVMSMPRAIVMRSFIMNHMIHHRAQLGVYLRLNNIPVPSIYGPSADEGQM